MKTRIFIGSSSEGLSIASEVKSKLETNLDCEVILWSNPGIFEFNKSALSSLIDGRLLYDFAILVATKDDLARFRGFKKYIPRDNVIFEFGLYLGSFGEHRTILIQESDVKLPTDLNGITVPRFSVKKKDLGHQVTQIISFIEEKIQYNEFQILPSTALAVGYYYSFLKNTAASINEDAKCLDLAGKAHKTVKVKVIIPTELSDDIGSKAKLKYTELNLSEGAINSGKRPFPIKYVFDSVQSDEVIIYDMPTTLSTIRHSCNLLMKKSHIGKSNNQSIIEQRELSNFKLTLENLIREDDYCKKIIEIVWEHEM